METKTNKVVPFYSGTEYMAWRSVNCAKCAKDCPFVDGFYGDALCDIEETLALESIGNGKVSQDIASRANLPIVNGTIVRCSEFVEV